MISLIFIFNFYKYSQFFRILVKKYFLKSSKHLVIGSKLLNIFLKTFISKNIIIANNTGHDIEFAQTDEILNY